MPFLRQRRSPDSFTCLPTQIYYLRTNLNTKMSNITVLAQAAQIAEYNPAAAQLLLELEASERQPQILEALANYDLNSQSES